MKVNKYKKNNNIIHIVEINNLEELKTVINNANINTIFERNNNFIDDFKSNICKLNGYNLDINIRNTKEYNIYGRTILMNKIITQNINCYKNNESNKTINIYYDLTNKFNSDDNIILNRFILTYILIMKLKKKNYKVNFIPVLFLKAFDSYQDNEYVYIKINNIDIKNIFNYNLILNNKISRIILPEIIKLLNIENKEALDYNGYLLERYEKENIIDIKNNDMIIDFFTSENLFNGNIIDDSEVFYKKLKL